MVVPVDEGVEAWLAVADGVEGLATYVSVWHTWTAAGVELLMDVLLVVVVDFLK